MGSGMIEPRGTCSRTYHTVGFERSEWELNDGAVNIHSMLRTWTPTTISRVDTCADSKHADRDCDSNSELDSSASTTSSSAASSPRTALLSVALFSSDFDDHTASSMSTSLSNDDEQAAVATGFYEPISTTAALDALELPLFSPHKRERLVRGHWYVHRVRKNHMAGTHFDRDAPQLFRHLLQVISSEFERD